MNTKLCPFCKKLDQSCPHCISYQPETNNNELIGGIIFAIIVAIIIFISVFIQSILSTNDDTTQLTPTPLIKIAKTNHCENSDVLDESGVTFKENCFEVECRFTSMDGERWKLERCDEIKE